MRPPRCLALLALLPAAAHADQILYHSDFENGVIDPQWGHSARLDQGPVFTTFMGRYAGSTQNNLNNSVSLSLPAVPPGDTGNGGAGGGSGGGGSPYYILNFDFYCIDSWDGNSTTLGPDLFEVYINGADLFSYTFSNNPNYGQSYPNLPTIGPSYLAFGQDLDSIYRNITIPFTVDTATDIVIKWRSNGLQAMSDESWGIDNVTVTYTAVPTPGAVALLGLSGLTLARRRRR